MGCCYSKPEEDPQSADTGWGMGEKPRCIICSSQDESLRFFILADSIRARHRSLGSMKHEHEVENFKVNMKLLTSGDLEVRLTRKGPEDDMRLSVAVLLMDDNIELMDTIIKEDTKKKDVPIAKVTFPMVALVKRIPSISFIVVAVSVTVGDTKVETNNDFSQMDYDTFFAWRGDQSDW